MNPFTVLLAVGANLSFAWGSIIFTKFSREVSALWMNSFKTTISLIAFVLACGLFFEFHPLQTNSILLFLLSGLVGLFIGDLLMLKAFSLIGPGRTLILFGMQPLIMGLLAHVFLNQGINLTKLTAIIFFMICFFIFTLEHYRLYAKWDLTGGLMAIAALSLDAVGSILSRLAFEAAPLLSSMEANVYRTLGAFMGVLLLIITRRLSLIEQFLELTPRNRALALMGPLLGTFLSLGLYLEAIKTAHLATLSGMAINGPLMVEVSECVIKKRLPSKDFFLSFPFFLVGVLILLWPQYT